MPPITSTRRAKATVSLCRLIPDTIYSALDGGDAPERLGLDAVKLASAAELSVEPMVLGGTVVSDSTAPSSSRLSSLNSIATSLIDWYRSSGSFARQRRTIRCRSIGADGFAFL